MKTKTAAMTMAEILVSVSLLGILMTAALAMYFMTNSVVASGRIRSELMSEIQVAANRLTRDIEGSAASCISIDSSLNAAGLISAVGDPSGYTLQPNGDLIWQKYVVYYLHNQELFRREIALGAGDPQRLNPTVIENYDPGGGSQALSAYLSGGRILARRLTRFELETLSNFSVRMRMAVETPATARTRAQKITLESVAFPRN